jgi:hypothetical protein
MESKLKSELELLAHANNCLKFFSDYQQENAFPEAYVGARYFFKFPNGFIISFVSESEVYIYNLNDESPTKIQEYEFTHFSEAGSWRFKDSFTPESLCELISRLSESWGKAELNFPWIEWLERYGPQSSEWEDILETLDPEDDLEEIDFFKAAQASEIFLDRITNEPPKDLIFDINSYCSGDSCLPKKCQYLRLRQYFEELENSGWIVIDHITNHDFAFIELESRREEESDDEYANGNPALVCPVEFVWQSYSPSGALNNWFAIIDSHVQGEVDELLCAEKFGLQIEIIDSKKQLRVTND